MTGRVGSKLLKLSFEEKVVTFATEADDTLITLNLDLALVIFEYQICAVFPEAAKKLSVRIVLLIHWNDTDTS